MSYLSLLNQTITLYSKTSLSQDGREVVGSGANHRARVKVKRKSILMPNGQVQVVDALAHLLPDVTIEVGDRILYNNVGYKVFGKHIVVGGDGVDHHIRVELIKWQI